MNKNLSNNDIDLIIAFANNNMDLSKTARKSFMHRNTAVYRLSKIKRNTGLNPRRFYDLFQLLQLAGVVRIQCDYFERNVGEDNE